ncbi:Glycosyl hydrolases family 16 [Mariniphaga anaerophila]|uniref:Glycosyl hydrolases family 16 n=1 Tax=Mariniphaga anaerophila TaxID=1484053 RepID=A0A1M4YTM6_9BACT|nr:glycoside hydrolase family 16 protein [Mariniphaga anaerophila]SHF08812.1 Glycosyl hydrolases family 16 [Mariniphaga anaerophila]
MGKGNLIYAVVVLLGMASCAPRGSQNKHEAEESGHGNYELVWSDEFDYRGLPDSTKWGYDTEGNDAGWGNQESQFYTEKRIENARVEDGILNVIALKEDYQNREYTSVRLISKESWQYGRFEIRAKLPAGRGTWAAIWMMPGGWSFNDGNWPDVGEFDIMEHVGHDVGVIHASAHSKDYQWQTGTQQTDTIRVDDATEAFHTYVWEWTQEGVKAYVDDKLFFEYDNEGLGEAKWPYDKPFYLILNVAVGGAWGNMKGIDDDAFPQIMEVDYVRVYRKK